MTLAELVDRFDDAVAALERIAAALEALVQPIDGERSYSVKVER